jgi:hypothetical protein
MASSWDSFQTSSMEGDGHEAKGRIPKKKGHSLDYSDPEDEDWDAVYISKPIYAPSPQVDWITVERFFDEEDAHKPNGKGRVDAVKFIATDRQATKCKRCLCASARTYGETMARASSTRKLTLNACMHMKPQKEWDGFYFHDSPFVPEKIVPKTKQRLQAQEVYKKQELIQYEIVI